MVDLDAVKKIIADSVEQITGLETIFANQNAPRPTTAYASVFVTPERKLGYDRITYSDSALELDETIEGNRKLSASINFFKDGANINASKFVGKLQSSSIIEFFKVNNIGFVGVSEIRDLSEVNKNLWEERAQLDMSFHALSTSTEEVLATKEINIDGITESGENDYNVNINVRTQ